MDHALPLQGHAGAHAEGAGRAAGAVHGGEGETARGYGSGGGSGWGDPWVGGLHGGVLLGCPFGWGVALLGVPFIEVFNGWGVHWVGVSPRWRVLLLGCPTLGSLYVGVSHYWGVSLLGCPTLGCPIIGVPPPHPVIPPSSFCSPHRTGAGPGTAEQDGQIRPAQPAGWGQPPGGVHAAQPARYGTAGFSWGCWGGPRVPWGPWVALMTP